MTFIPLLCTKTQVFLYVQCNKGEVELSIKVLSGSEETIVQSEHLK